MLMIRRNVDRASPRLRYLLALAFTTMAVPAWAVPPVAEQFPAEPGTQATVSLRTTLPDGTRRVEGRAPNHNTYRVEAHCTLGTVAMYRLDADGQWDQRYAARRRGEGWERSTLEGPIARIDAGTNLDWLATAQHDSLCTPKVWSETPRAAQK